MIQKSDLLGLWINICNFGTDYRVKYTDGWLYGCTYTDVLVRLNLHWCTCTFVYVSRLVSIYRLGSRFSILFRTRLRFVRWVETMIQNLFIVKSHYRKKQIHTLYWVLVQSKYLKLVDPVIIGELFTMNRQSEVDVCSDNSTTMKSTNNEELRRVRRDVGPSTSEVTSTFVPPTQVFFVHPFEEFEDSWSCI